VRRDRGIAREGRGKGSRASSEKKSPELTQLEEGIFPTQFPARWIPHPKEEKREKCQEKECSHRKGKTILVSLYEGRERCQNSLTYGNQGAPALRRRSGREWPVLCVKTVAPFCGAKGPVKQRIQRKTKILLPREDWIRNSASDHWPRKTKGTNISRPKRGAGRKTRERGAARGGRGECLPLIEGKEESTQPKKDFFQAAQGTRSKKRKTAVGIGRSAPAMKRSVNAVKGEHVGKKRQPQAERRA